MTKLLVLRVDPELPDATGARHLDQRGLSIVEPGQRGGVLFHLSDGRIDAALQTLSVGITPLGVTDQACSHQADHQIDPDARVSDHNFSIAPLLNLQNGGFRGDE